MNIVSQKLVPLVDHPKEEGIQKWLSKQALLQLLLNILFDHFFLCEQAWARRTIKGIAYLTCSSKFFQDYSKWVICRVYERDEDDDGTELSCLDEVYLSLDDLDEISFPN